MAREALAGYSLLLEADGANPELLHQRGVLFYELGYYEDSLKDLSTALQLRPEFSRCRYSLALTLEAVGREDDALEEYSQVIRDDPKHVSAHNNRGTIYLKNGQLRDALTDFLAASKLDPNHAKSKFNSGCVMGALGRYPEAIDFLTQAISLNPDYDRAYLHRAKAYIEAEMYSSAESDLERASSLECDRATLHALKARLHLANNRLDLFEKEAREAATIDAECAELRLLLQQHKSFRRSLGPASEERAVVNSATYKDEDAYRDQMRPTVLRGGALAQSRDTLSALFLAEAREELVEVVEKFPVLLHPVALKFLKELARDNPPLRKKLNNFITIAEYAHRKASES